MKRLGSKKNQKNLPFGIFKTTEKAFILINLFLLSSQFEGEKK